jgi:hypothetical protein
VVLWLVIDPCVNFVDVCIVIFGIYIFNSSIFWDTRRWIKSKNTIRSILTHHRQNPTEINVNTSWWTMTILRWYALWNNLGRPCWLINSPYDFIGCVMFWRNKCLDHSNLCPPWGGKDKNPHPHPAGVIWKGTYIQDDSKLLSGFPWPIIFQPKSTK